MNTVQENASELGTAPVCNALGVSRASYYRHLKPKVFGPAQNLVQRPVRALSGDERQQVLDLLHSERFRG